MIQRIELSYRTKIIFCATLINIFAAETVQAFSVSQISTKYDLRFYPATKEGARVLIPFSNPPEKDIEVVLLHGSEDIFRLKAGGRQKHKALFEVEQVIQSKLSKHDTQQI